MLLSGTNDLVKNRFRCLENKIIYTCIPGIVIFEDNKEAGVEFICVCFVDVV